MKKIFNLSLVILLIMLFFTSTVYAAINATMTLSPSKTKYEKDEEIVVSVKVKTDKAFVALGSTLEYDKENLEYVKMQGQNGWDTPSYNPENGRLVTTGSKTEAFDETLFTITFKAKTDNVSNVKITMKDTEVGDGDSEEAQLKDVTTTISIAEAVSDPSTPDNPSNPSTPSEPDNPSDSDKPSNPNNSGNKDTNTNTNTNKNNNTNSNTNSNNNSNQNKAKNTNVDQGDNLVNKILPKTGGGNVLIISLIVIAFVVGIAYFYKLKILKISMGEDKKRKKH